jgi:hypothetical protein
MRFLKIIGMVLFVTGLAGFYPPATHWLTFHFGHAAAQYGGLVSCVVGWAVLGASLAFSAGFRYQQSRVETSARNVLVNERK